MVIWFSVIFVLESCLISTFMDLSRIAIQRATYALPNSILFISWSFIHSCYECYWGLQYYQTRYKSMDKFLLEPCKATPLQLVIKSSLWMSMISDASWHHGWWFMWRHVYFSLNVLTVYWPRDNLLVFSSAGQHCRVLGLMNFSLVQSTGIRWGKRDRWTPD